MFGVSSFLKMCARWDSAVFTLIPRASATSFVVLPSATSYRTSRSRGVSGSGGSSDFARYAWTSVRETRGLRYIMPLSTSWIARTRSVYAWVFTTYPLTPSRTASST